MAGAVAAAFLIFLLRPSARSSSREGAMGGSITLRNPHGLEVVVLLRGAIIQSLRVPDTDGNVEDVVLGFDEEAPYKVGCGGGGGQGTSVHGYPGHHAHMHPCPSLLLPGCCRTAPRPTWAP